MKKTLFDMEKSNLTKQVEQADVSPQTRKLLVIMAAFMEAADEFNMWCDANLANENRNKKEFNVIFEEMYNCVEETLTDYIQINMRKTPCKQI